MPGTGFSPREVLFSPTGACNLRCAHCSVSRERTKLPIAAAVKFLKSCRRAGVQRVGFTGGEPFLDLPFLLGLTVAAVEEGLLFDRITTNAAWFKDEPRLGQALGSLQRAGYDGDFGVSVDAFHGTDPDKAALFIRTAAGVWNRPDIARVLAVRGGRDAATEALLHRLAGTLKARIVRRGGRRVIRGESLILPITPIDLVPVGKAESLADPWGKAWFDEDYCQGPGQVLYVLPDGTVKPCCGYATDSPRLTLGHIQTHSAAQLIRSATRNKFVAAIFGRGLSTIRRCLIRNGVLFPGKTANHCFFCHYILTRVPPPLLNKCL